MVSLFSTFHLSHVFSLASVLSSRPSSHSNRRNCGKTSRIQCDSRWPSVCRMPGLWLACQKVVLGRLGNESIGGKRFRWRQSNFAPFQRTRSHHFVGVGSVGWHYVYGSVGQKASDRMHFDEWGFDHKKNSRLPNDCLLDCNWSQNSKTLLGGSIWKEHLFDRFQWWKQTRGRVGKVEHPSVQCSRQRTQSVLVWFGQKWHFRLQQDHGHSTQHHLESEQNEFHSSNANL